MSKITGKNDGDESSFDVGGRLKSLRAESGLTLRELAKRSDVAFTTIQKIESGSISPTIGILMKIAGGLRVKITALLEQETPSRRVHFIAKKDRVRASGKGLEIDVQYVAQSLIKPEIVGFHIAVAPGQGSGSDPLSHGGEELVVGIQGVTTFAVEDEEFLVGPGDSLHFKSVLPHSWTNTGSKTSKFYLICSDWGLAPSPPNRI
jgi:transcriptional regulator with XRE-family HTH domain